MLAQKKDACDLTGRTEAMGAKLVCTLATNGRPDKNAIDDLIAGFEDAYGPNERDVNLWKAYFRGHAEFITVDQAILDANERERVARQSQRPPGAGRATRADDVSSDSEEEDCAFDPLVVVRTSSEGRMLSKWLDAARKRLGGTFPRDAARAEMEAYAEKMRRRKLKGGKQAVAGVVEDETTEAARLEKRVVRLSQASTALARRWLRAAQDSIQARFSAPLAFVLPLFPPVPAPPSTRLAHPPPPRRPTAYGWHPTPSTPPLLRENARLHRYKTQARFRERGKKLRDDCEECLGEMPEEDEWFYGADLRFEGRQVLTRGDALRADQLTLEAEAAVRVRRIEADFQVFEQAKQVRVAAPFFPPVPLLPPATASRPPAGARLPAAPAGRRMVPSTRSAPSRITPWCASTPSPRRPTPSPRPLTFVRSRRRRSTRNAPSSRPSSRSSPTRRIASWSCGRGH